MNGSLSYDTKPDPVESAKVASAGSSDVNEYLKQISGQDFNAKDFRTWSGTVFASLALQEFKKFDSQTQAKKNVLRAFLQKRLKTEAVTARK